MGNYANNKLTAPKIASKYHNRKTIIDNIRFDSKKEARKYQELKLLMKCDGPDGVRNFILQPRFELLPGFIKDGQQYRKIEYVADFDVFYNDGRREIIDVKGMETAIFKLKAKWFDYLYKELTLVIE